jgi:hypothetical protein
MYSGVAIPQHSSGAEFSLLKCASSADFFTKFAMLSRRAASLPLVKSVKSVKSL